MPDALRVALLSYRSKPHCGGQGEYVRHLSRELVGLGHRVQVFSGPPYPQLDPGVALTRVPSLDLYREPDPFRTPRPGEFRSAIDVFEWLSMCTGAFPEPLTFSLRVHRGLRRTPDEFDVVHDNQGLGYGLLGLPRSGPPVVATVHHPLTVDRRIEMVAAPNLRRRIAVRRWYSLVRMQRRVARRLPALTTVSAVAKADIVRDFRVEPDKVRVIPVGIDERVFRRAGTPAVPNRLVATASADVPLKGLRYLLEAVAKLRAERPVELVVVGPTRAGGATAQALDSLGLRGAVRFVTGLPDRELAELIRSAVVAVVPSLYEGFCLPAVEAMACGTALVATTAGALPEITGRDGECALQVPPADVDALVAAIGRLLDDVPLRSRLGAAGAARAAAQFSWRATAQRTAAWYEEVRAARC
jgi:glycosyltransferase involved in cell wall biosynthesis